MAPRHFHACERRNPLENSPENRNFTRHIPRELVERMQISFSFHTIHPTTWSITTESVTMATFQHSARRLILAGGFAVAVAAAPAIAVFAVPTPDAAPVAQCPPGEEPDNFTAVCVPHTVPNAGSPFQSIPGNPSIPAVTIPGGGGAIPCTGHNSGQCIGLAEEAQAEGPAAVPESTIGSSPTVTGSIG
jgi:hypothetical protein